MKTYLKLLLITLILNIIAVLFLHYIWYNMNPNILEISPVVSAAATAVIFLIPVIADIILSILWSRGIEHDTRAKQLLINIFLMSTNYTAVILICLRAAQFMSAAGTVRYMG